MCHQSSSEELLFSSQKAYEGHWEYNDKYNAIPYHHFSFLSIKTGINICHYKTSSIKKNTTALEGQMSSILLKRRFRYGLLNG